MTVGPGQALLLFSSGAWSQGRFCCVMTDVCFPQLLAFLLQLPQFKRNKMLVLFCHCWDLALQCPKVLILSSQGRVLLRQVAELVVWGSNKLVGELQHRCGWAWLLKSSPEVGAAPAGCEGGGRLLCYNYKGWCLIAASCFRGVCKLRRCFTIAAFNFFLSSAFILVDLGWDLSREASWAL